MGSGRSRPITIPACSQLSFIRSFNHLRKFLTWAVLSGVTLPTTARLEIAKYPGQLAKGCFRHYVFEQNGMKRLIPRALGRQDDSIDLGGNRQSPATPKTEQIPDTKSPYGIKVWYDPTKGTDLVPHLFDLIFVHGLTGDHANSWTHPKRTEPWPKLLIPEDFPGARVMSYGYDAYVMLKKKPVSTTNLSNHSLDFLNEVIAQRKEEKVKRKPLIFVAHSLGGIVCKDALLKSRISKNEPEKNVFDDTLGVIFMGTPHNGAGLARWAKVPATALGVVKSTNKKLLEVLQTENEILIRIQHEFIQQVKSTTNTNHEIHVTCFYETLPMHGFMQIVPFDSAILPGYNHISIHSDHKNMIKFLAKCDDGYQKFAGVLRRYQDLLTERGASTGLSANELNRSRGKCLASLAFPEMHFRSSAITGPIQDTCDWILGDHNYRLWTLSSPKEIATNHHAGDKNTTLQRTGSDLLLISGKPGSGKSTLIKKLFGVHSEPQYAQESTCLGFFFNARGTAILEKSSLGLYRSLLFQLLHLNSTAFRIILPLLRQKEAVETSREFKWHESEVSEQFFKILEDARMRDITIFIDGIDECQDNDAARDIVASFEHALQNSLGIASNLRVCLSSRPYRQIRPKHALELQVELQNSLDIDLYIDRELLLQNFGTLTEIKSKLARKANGVFLWVVLVVKTLRREWDRGCAPHGIKRILEDLPPKLEELYFHIIRSMSQEQLNLTCKIAQLVLFAEAPLSPNDVDVILTLTSNPPGHSLIEIASTSPANAHALSQYRAHVTEVTGGLFELSPSTPIYVQIIHETVRRFFTSGKTQFFHDLSIQGLDEGTSKEMIRTAIRNYALSTEFRGYFSLDTGERNHISNWAGFCRQSIPSELCSLSRAAPGYIVEHGLSYLDNGTGSADERGRQLQMTLEYGGWLYAFALISHDQSCPYNYAYSEKSREFLCVLDRHNHNLGFNDTEFESLAVSMNNRSKLLNIFDRLGQELGDSRHFGYDWQQPVYKFHLACWSAAYNRTSVVQITRMLDRKHNAEKRRGSAITPIGLTRICFEKSAGLAFTASFSWTTNATELRSVPEDWVLYEDHDKFLELIGWESKHTKSQSLEEMPFHLNSESGYIALILVQKDTTESHNEEKLSPCNVFAVLETDSSPTWRTKNIKESGKQKAPGLGRRHSNDSMETHVNFSGSESWFAWDKEGEFSKQIPYEDERLRPYVDKPPEQRPVGDSFDILSNVGEHFDRLPEVVRSHLELDEYN